MHAAPLQAMLPRQLVEPVQWESTIKKLVGAGQCSRACSLYTLRQAALRPQPLLLPPAVRRLPTTAALLQPVPQRTILTTAARCATAPAGRPAGKKELFELGPGQQIKAMVKRIDPTVWGAFKNLAA